MYSIDFAVTELIEKRCKGIKLDEWKNHLILDGAGYLRYSLYPHGHYEAHSQDLISQRWVFITEGAA